MEVRVTRVARSPRKPFVAQTLTKRIALATTIARLVSTTPRRTVSLSVSIKIHHFYYKVHRCLLHNPSILLQIATPKCSVSHWLQNAPL